MAFMGFDAIGATALHLKAGAVDDHVYLSFFAVSAAQSTRSGYMGYAAAGVSTLTIANERAGGDLHITTPDEVLITTGSTTGIRSSGRIILGATTGVFAADTKALVFDNFTRGGSICAVNNANSAIRKMLYLNSADTPGFGFARVPASVPGNFSPTHYLHTIDHAGNVCMIPCAVASW
jgi:hypothetical protein